jgi:hypothetical protein
MRRTICWMLLGLLTAAGAVTATQAAKRAPAASRQSNRIPEDEEIWGYLHGYRTRNDLSQVTPKPFHVAWAGSPLCARPNAVLHSPHGEHWIHVFASSGARGPLTTGKGSYPVGAVILKQKFLDAKGTKTDFYTGMRKREKGYHPGGGDWEYFMLDSQRSMVLARGKIDSCVGCHDQYRSTDFVSRRYLTGKEDTAW